MRAPGHIKLPLHQGQLNGLAIYDLRDNLVAKSDDRKAVRLIVTAVNSHAELLAAAKHATAAVDTLRLTLGLNFDLADLKAAIVHAEESAP